MSARVSGSFFGFPNLFYLTSPSKPHSGRNLAPLVPNLAFQVALQAQLGASWAQLGPPSRTSRATWRLGVRFWLSLPSSKSSSCVSGGLIFTFLQSCISRPSLGLNLQALGLNLELTGSLLGRTWPYLGASWTQLGASWALLGFNSELLGASWAPLGRLLSSTWALLAASGRLLGLLGLQVDSKWAPSGLQVVSKWPPSGLQVVSKWPPSALQVPCKCPSSGRTDELQIQHTHEERPEEAPSAKLLLDHRSSFQEDSKCSLSGRGVHSKCCPSGRTDELPSATLLLDCRTALSM